MDGLEQLALQFEGIYVNPSEGTARMRPHFAHQGLSFRPMFERNQRHSEIKRRMQRGLVINTCVEIK